MPLGDGTRDAVETAIQRLQQRHDDVTVETTTTHDDPDFFQHGIDVANATKLAGAGAFVTDTDDRALLIRESDTPNTWELPAGGLEPGETPTQNARREVREETGIDATITDVWKVIHRTIRHRDDPARELHTYHAWFDATTTDTTTQLDPTNWAPDEEILDARWFTTPPKSVDETVHERLDDTN